MSNTIKTGTKFRMGGSEWIIGEPLEEGPEKEALLDIFDPLIKASEGTSSDEEAFLKFMGEHPEFVKNMIPGSLKHTDNGYTYTSRLSFGNSKDFKCVTGHIEDE